MKLWIRQLRDWWRARRARPLPPSRKGGNVEAGDAVEFGIRITPMNRDITVIGEVIYVAGGYATVLCQFETSILAGRLRKK